VFVTYDGKRACDIALSRYAVRHLVASEVSFFFLAHLPSLSISIVAHVDGAVQIEARIISRQSDGGHTQKPGKQSFFGKR
jgi:hypothetical protein